MEIQNILQLAFQAFFLLTGFFCVVIGYVWLNARFGHRVQAIKKLSSLSIEP